MIKFSLYIGKVLANLFRVYVINVLKKLYFNTYFHTKVDLNGLQFQFIVQNTYCMRESCLNYVTACTLHEKRCRDKKKKTTQS